MIETNQKTKCIHALFGATDEGLAQLIAEYGAPVIHSDGAPVIHDDPDKESLVTQDDSGSSPVTQKSGHNLKNKIFISGDQLVAAARAGEQDECKRLIQHARRHTNQ